MSKLIITREYELPEENALLEIDMAASRMHDALCAIKSSIRSIWKYEYYSEEVGEMVNRIYQEICDEINTTGLEM